jgi:hemerythrin superfamily protein
MATTEAPKPAPKRAPAKRTTSAAKRPAKPAAEAKPAEAEPEGAKSRIGVTGTVIGAAAAGLAAGLVANLGRKAVVQAPSALAGDWLELVKTEHRLALTLFDKLQATTDSDAGKRSTLLAQLKHALGKHAFTEENVLYPALREAGDPADADELNHEHGYVKQYLYELEMMPKDSAEFLPKVAAFRADIEHHVHEEEDRIFPALHARLGAEKNKVLTLAANKEGFKLA